MTCVGNVIFRGLGGNCALALYTMESSTSNHKPGSIDTDFNYTNTPYTRHLNLYSTSFVSTLTGNINVCLHQAKFLCVFYGLIINHLFVIW